MALPKGSIIVADGNGKVTSIQPTSNGQVLSLDSTEPSGAKFISLPIQRLKANAVSTNSTNLTTYTKIIELSVPGENVSNLTNINVISYKSGSVTSYDVRAIDANTSLVIAESNFSNNVPAINNLGPLSNLPSGPSIIEILAKRNGGGGNNKNVYISEANIDLL